MGWIDSLLGKTANALRFKGVGIQSGSSPVRLSGTCSIDSFFVAQVSAANYIVVAESDQGITESMQASVVVNMTPDRSAYLAKVAVYGRISTGVQLIDLTATVDKGQVSLNASTHAGAPGTIQVKKFATYMEKIYGN